MSKTEEIEKFDENAGNISKPTSENKRSLTRIEKLLIFSELLRKYKLKQNNSNEKSNKNA